MTPLLIKNTKALKNTLKDAVDYRDILYSVVKKGRSTICSGGSAIINEYKMWLQSDKYDYIREPDFGGFFANCLNDKFAFEKDSEPLVQAALVAATEKDFPDIKLISCDVTCDAPGRAWKIKVIVQDRTTGLVADDMATYGDSILVSA